MSHSRSWKCPYCNHNATITASNEGSAKHVFNSNNKDGLLLVLMHSIVCPNPDCREYQLSAALYKGQQPINGSGTFISGDPLAKWQLRPQSTARPFPDYIPAAILDDYTEACLIRDLSPKASATLSRRCMQGMIRDFWGVKEKNLFEEINAIAGKVDPAIFDAIDAVRKIGNIGAHMEKDINLVIDVEPEEAQMLIQLIEVLIEEWYVARKLRADHLLGIVALAAAKKPSLEVQAGSAPAAAVRA
jgi:hypothetical protein